MTAMVQAAILLIQQLLPFIQQGSVLVGGVETVTRIIGWLEAIIPALTQEVSDLVPTIKHIIATVRGSSNVTKDQLDQLDAIEAKIDAAFDAAAAAADAEDAAAAASAKT